MATLRSLLLALFQRGVGRGGRGASRDSATLINGITLAVRPSPPPPPPALHQMREKIFKISSYQKMTGPITGEHELAQTMELNKPNNEE